MPINDLLFKKVYRNVIKIKAKILCLDTISKKSSFILLIDNDDEKAELCEINIITVNHLIVKVDQTVPKASLLIEMINLLYKFIYIINLIYVKDLKNYFSKKIKMHLGEFGHLSLLQ